MSGEKPGDQPSSDGPESSDVNQDSARPGAVLAPDHIAAHSDSPPQQPFPPAPRRRGFGWIVLALVLAVAALGLSAWQFYQQFDQAGQGASEDPVAVEIERRLANLEGESGELRRRMDGIASGQQASDQGLEDVTADLGRLRQSVQALEAQLDPDIADEVGELRRQLDELGGELGELAGRLGQALDELADRGDLERRVDRDLQRQMLMLEAAGLLRAGQERAELAEDFPAAILAYRRAAERLEGIDDVRLDRVRRALARELDALEALRAPDLGRELARLERLGRATRQWPTQLGDADRPHIAEDDLEDDLNAGRAVDRATQDMPWRERLGGALRGLVRVQSRDAIGRTGEQFGAAREQLELRLVAAQLALTRRDAGALALHLEAALELLDEWFDPASAAVVEGRAEIEAVASMQLDVSAPELGEALDLLRDRLGAF